MSDLSSPLSWDALADVPASDLPRNMSPTPPAHAESASREEVARSTRIDREVSRARALEEARHELDEIFDGNARPGGERCHASSVRFVRGMSREAPFDDADRGELREAHERRERRIVREAGE